MKTWVRRVALKGSDVFFKINKQKKKKTKGKCLTNSNFYLKMENMHGACCTKSLNPCLWLYLKARTFNQSSCYFFDVAVHALHWWLTLESLSKHLRQCGWTAPLPHALKALTSGRASAVLMTESAYVCAIVCQKCCVYTPGHLNIHASRYDFASKHLCAQYACECEVSAYCVCAFMHVPEKS